MSETSPINLADDYYKRLEKDFRPKFVEDVDNPTLLVDHLTCLETIDEDIVRAQQIQFGPTKAASVLYHRLTRRPNWIEDVIRALSHNAIGLEHLAEQLERFELTVPARWDISIDECSNGHCSDIGAVRNDDTSEATEEDITRPTPDQASSKAPIPTAIGNAETAVLSEKFKPIKSSTEQAQLNQNVPTEIGHATGPLAEVPSMPKNNDVKENHSLESIRLRKELIRVEMMEKICSYVQTPRDVPIAIHHMEQINMQIDKIARGSVLFSIYIGSLQALHTFEQLWRYGGLKKLLDKEMLDKKMIKELKGVATEAGYPVEDIQSELNIFETDIERCRSWLIRKQFDIRPVNFTDMLMNMESNGKTETEITKEVVKYAMDRLPEELQAMTEDPFVSDRIRQFYEFDLLRNIYTNEQHRKLSDDTQETVSQATVSQCFAKWLNNELAVYLRKLDDTTKSNLLALATYLVHRVEYGDTASIPYKTFSETSRSLHTKANFPTETYYKNFWFDMQNVPSELIIDDKTIDRACTELSEKRLICQSRSEFKFYSVLLRDVFITKVALCRTFRGSLKSITESFEYVQTLIGMYETKLRNYASLKAEAEFPICAFKTPELREIGICGRSEHEKSITSSFYTQDLIKNDDVKVSKDVLDAGNKIKQNLRISEKMKLVTVDMSQAMVDKSFSIEAALHWLNVEPKDYRYYARSLICSNNKITARDLESIGLYLNATPDGLDLSLRNCGVDGGLLTNVLETGHFRNIRYLNMSDNKELVKSSQPLGLMYIRSLERLELQNCNLGDNGIKVLAMDLTRTDKLRELNLANNRISSKGFLELSKALATNKRITGLRIHKNNIGKEGSWILASLLEQLILLEVLNISECGIGDRGSQEIANSLVSRSLRKLSMRQNELTPKGSREFFKHFRRPPYLEHFDFSENALFMPRMITPAMADDLPPSGIDEPFVEFLQSPGPMSHLSLWNTCVGERRIFQSLQNLQCFEEITYLCLQENNISDSFASDLSTYITGSEGSHLQHFNLRQNRIGTFGAINIAKALSKQRYLKEVFLDRNEIGDEGANEIVKSCAVLPVIEHIDLSCNNVSKKMCNIIVSNLEELRVLEFVRKHDSFDENSFIIIRESDKFVVTM